MTDRELILNFINQYDRPFNAELIAKLTSTNKEAIEHLLPELLQSQAIKQIEDDPPIYHHFIEVFHRFDKMALAQYHIAFGWKG